MDEAIFHAILFLNTVSLIVNKLTHINKTIRTQDDSKRNRGHLRASEKLLNNKTIAASEA